MTSPSNNLEEENDDKPIKVIACKKHDWTEEFESQSCEAAEKIARNNPGYILSQVDDSIDGYKLFISKKHKE